MFMRYFCFELETTSVSRHQNQLEHKHRSILMLIFEFAILVLVKYSMLNFTVNEYSINKIYDLVAKSVLNTGI